MIVPLVGLMLKVDSNHFSHCSAMSQFATIKSKW